MSNRLYSDEVIDYYTAYIISVSDYSPFGVELANRSWSIEEYRIGFNTQENVPEIAPGQTTAMYWEYNARLGRRWQLDPVLKTWESSYACFSNNPIIMIDPKGNTDFYNKRGKCIGNDGVANGESSLVLTKTTAQRIKKETKANGFTTLGNIKSHDVIPIFDGLVASMDNAYSTSEKSHKEEGFAVGKSSKTGQYYTETAPQGSTGMIEWWHASDKIKANGDQIITDAHVHPPSLVTQLITNMLIVHGEGEPSQGDMDNYNNAKTSSEYNYAGPIIILGYTMPNEMTEEDPNVRKADAKPRTIVNLDPANYTKKISFFTGKENVSMSYHKFKKVAYEILNSSNQK